jgi:hypothetical protein
MTEQETADDIIHWLKDDIKCLYMISELKKEIKQFSEQRYQFFDKVHIILLDHFIKD